MQLTEFQRGELQACLQTQPSRVLFATACGPLLYGFPHQDRYVDLRGVHFDPDEGPETREWRMHRPGCHVEWVSHEVGKFVRLMQLNNAGAYEQLFSPHVAHQTPALRELRALGAEMRSLQLVVHYRECFRARRAAIASLRETQIRPLLYLYRLAFSGLYLLETGRLNCDLPELARYFEHVAAIELLRENVLHADCAAMRRHRRELEQLESWLQRAPNRAGLPEQVPGRQMAEDWLSRLRTEGAARLER